MSNQSGSSTPSDDRVIQTQDSARPYSGRARGANPGQFPNRGPAASDAIFAAEAQCALLAEQLRTTQHALADTTSRPHAVEQAAAANARPPQFPPGWIDSMRERDLLTQQLTNSRTAQAAAHANERADMRAHINTLAAHINTIATAQTADHAQLESARAQHVIDRFTMRDFDENRGRLQAATESAQVANQRAEACALEVTALATRLQTAELREANALLSVTDLRALTQELQNRLAATQAAQTPAGQGYPPPPSRFPLLPFATLPHNPSPGTDPQAASASDLPTAPAPAADRPTAPCALRTPAPGPAPSALTISAQPRNPAFLEMRGPDSLRKATPATPALKEREEGSPLPLLPPPPLTSGHSPAPAQRRSDPGMPAAPSEPAHPSPSLRQLCDANPPLQAIWAALTAPRVARLNNALSLHTASIRVNYATAFLEVRAALAPGGDSDRAAPAIATAAAARVLTATFLATLQTTPTPRHAFAPRRLTLIREQLAAVIGPGPEDDFTQLTPERTRHTPGPLAPFEHTTHMCLAALCDGWEIEECVRMWARIHTGTFSLSGRTFRPGPYRAHAEDYDWSSIQVRTISRALGEAPVSIYISHGQIVAITAGSRLRTRSSRPTGAPSLSLNDLPSFIALPRDKEGRPIIPKSRVTALVEAQEAWHHELGSLDSVTSTIVRGLLVMPKIASPTQRKVFRNHPSWEDNPEAQQALGPIIAKWLAQGVLEYVQWDDRQPILLQPC